MSDLHVNETYVHTDFNEAVCLLNRKMTVIPSGANFKSYLRNFTFTSTVNSFRSFPKYRGQTSFSSHEIDIVSARFAQFYEAV